MHLQLHCTPTSLCTALIPLSLQLTVKRVLSRGIMMQTRPCIVPACHGRAQLCGPVSSAGTFREHSASVTCLLLAGASASRSPPAARLPPRGCRGVLRRWWSCRPRRPATTPPASLVTSSSSFSAFSASPRHPRAPARPPVGRPSSRWSR